MAPAVLYPQLRQSLDFVLSGIHDTTVNALVSACDNLERLNLRGCYNVGGALHLNSDTLTELNAQVREGVGKFLCHALSEVLTCAKRGRTGVCRAPTLTTKSCRSCLELATCASSPSATVLMSPGPRLRAAFCACWTYPCAPSPMTTLVRTVRAQRTLTYLQVTPGGPLHVVVCVGPPLCSVHLPSVPRFAVVEGRTVPQAERASR